MTPNIILSTRKLTMKFGGLVALSALDIEVARGTIHSIIGPNGAGKTTAFNCIMQNHRASSGAVYFNGERMDGLTPDYIAAAGMARTYQNIRLFRNITAIENLLIGMHIHLRARWWDAVFGTRLARLDEARAEQEAIRLLGFVGLAGKGDIVARNLPYGEQRRLEIGRALATRPSLLMLDEPTAGMNPSEISTMMAFIRHIRDAMAMTIVLIEHQMRLVMTISDCVTVLDHGVKIAEGAPSEVQRDSRVIEAYLGTGVAAGIRKRAIGAASARSVDGLGLQDGIA